MMGDLMKKDNNWARLLAYVTGLVNQELLLQNEYLAAENRILWRHLPARLRLSDPERCTLAEIGKRMVRKALDQVACVVRINAMTAWRLIALAGERTGSGVPRTRNLVHRRQRAAETPSPFVRGTQAELLAPTSKSGYCMGWNPVNINWYASVSLS